MTLRLCFSERRQVETNVQENPLFLFPSWSRFHPAEINKDPQMVLSLTDDPLFTEHLTTAAFK